MDGVLQDLRSPRWWFAIVVAGIGVSLVSAYLKPLVDRLFDSIRRAWRARSQKRQAKHVNRIKRLTGDNHRQLLASMFALRLRQSALTSLILGLSLSGLALIVRSQNWRILLMALSISQLIDSLRDVYEASQTDRAVYEAAAPEFAELRNAEKSATDV